MSRTLKIVIASVAAILIAVVITPFLPKRSAQLPACQQILRQFEIGKELWADNESKTTNDTPTWGDIRPFLPEFITNHLAWTNGRPACPGGGAYTIGRVGELPKCSIGGDSHSP